MDKITCVLMALTIFLTGCGKLAATFWEDQQLVTDIQDEASTADEMPIDDSKIELDSVAENFQASHALALQNSRYMEKNCRNVNVWNEWKNLPMKYCHYLSDGQMAEILMLNAGPRRISLWLQEACASFAKDLSSCMEKAFRQILEQSGGQFPVAGVVIEDMDGNNRGNAYAFRNGVTVQISSFGTGTESILNPAQIAKSFTDDVIKTYTYARPISTTREQLTKYAAKVGLSIPDLGSSAERRNNFNLLVGDLYRQAWKSRKNHLIRSWIYSQEF